MARGNILSYLFFAIILLFSTSCKTKTDKNISNKITRLPYFNAADFTPEWDTPKHKIPEFAFINQKGDTVNNNTYKGKIYIADFFFTSCPGICPKLTKNMAVIQEAYKADKDIMLLSHTVMPWRDSVPLLKRYAEKYNVNSNKWHLVTGDKDALYAIARTGYFADEDFTKTQDENNFIHTENFVLVDKLGYIRGVYNGTLPIDVERLKRHIEILKQEI
ncbi:SCO family protein [Hyunsoonleella pacifica]|uniref:SCO family protein n=1 Tax=Hyunsoonleella pacifica TaxID=1080224 RepID=A0A4Q9FMK0_9FLAO|nr:SCO family protein [Hyunsoonleella pacifica]TBN15431.1 SCO family protein [Hyunsoonleella pacifica]GGD24023.1 SCO family protein [Hyunsoonleella pacifica]